MPPSCKGHILSIAALIIIIDPPGDVKGFSFTFCEKIQKNPAVSREIPGLQPDQFRISGKEQQTDCHHCHITRQGVRDSIKRAEAQLREYEEKLGLARRFVEIQAGLDEITRCAHDISIYNDKFLGSAEVEKRTARICELASQLND